MKRWINIAAWGLFFAAVGTTLVFAAREQGQSIADPPSVAISVEDENAFLTEDELRVRLKRKGLIYPGQHMDEVNTAAIEDFIRKMHEVESVQVFRRMGEHWDIRLKIRKPLARIFNNSGESFYIDSKGTTMDPTPNFQARILVFSGNIPDRSDTLTVDEIINNDSLKSIRILDDIYRISNYVCQDPFLRAQISQIHRTNGGDFVLIPQVGDHRIIFGTASSEADVKEKMDKLKVFYKEGLPYEGWNKYETINLKFRDQVVCKKKEQVQAAELEQEQEQEEEH
jgi:cell division protein FtsQ